MPPLSIRPGSAAALLALTAAARAEGAAPSSTKPCTEGVQSALAEVACEVAAGIGAREGPALVAAGAPASDPRLPRGAELASKLAALVAGALGNGARALPGNLSRGEAFGRASSSETLVYLAPEIRGGELRVVADAFTGGRSFWDRIRTPSPSPFRHAFSARRLDGEVASFLPEIKLVATRIDRARHSTTDVVAIGCGDVYRDGALELVVVGRQKISLGRIRNRRFEAVSEALWADLTPVAPSPLKDPIGAVAITPGRYVAVGSSDRASGVRLAPSLAPVGTLDGAVPWPFVGCLARSGTALGLPGPCARGEVPRVSPDGSGDVDAVASGRAVDRDGKARTVAAWRAPDGTVNLKDDAGRSARVPSAGAALAAGDVDLDGAPDLLHSLDTLTAGNDALVVRSWVAPGAIPERLRLPVPDGIRAVTTCPAESSGLVPIVLATPRELWVIQ